MSPAIDILVSPTLRHLRARWWNNAFTEFLAETLKPRPGRRILDVGCGRGTGELAIGRLHISQLRMVGIDRMADKVAAARREVESHNMRASFAAGDASRLPFRDAAFDSTFCVAVLQHVPDAQAAVAEFARVTARGGRVLAVEPDNTGRDFYSSVPSGREAFEASCRFFAETTMRADVADASVGPRLPEMLARHEIEPIEVQLFPVAQSQLGVPEGDFWRERRAGVEQAVAEAHGEAARALGRAYLDALARYEADAEKAGSAFVEIQNTMLFATVGQRAG
jgi:SAM-dependent methyltransferase